MAARFSSSITSWQMGIPGVNRQTNGPTFEISNLMVPRKSAWMVGAVWWMVNPNLANELLPSTLAARCGGMITYSIVLVRTKSPGFSVRNSPLATASKLPYRRLRPPVGPLPDLRKCRRRWAVLQRPKNDPPTSNRLPMSKTFRQSVWDQCPIVRIPERPEYLACCKSSPPTFHHNCPLVLSCNAQEFSGLQRLIWDEYLPISVVEIPHDECL